MPVHLQSLRHWRENEIRPFAACNHSANRHGFGCQQFTKAMVAAINWLKSLYPSEWCGVGEERGVTPKPLETVITLPVYTSPNTTPSLSFTVWKTKGWDLIRGQIRFACVRVRVPTCLWCVFARVHTLMCVPALRRDQEVATSFTRSSRVRKPLSAWRADRRAALAMDGALQMKKINKNGGIVSEAMGRISAGVWGQSGARNSLSIGKHICHVCLVGKMKTQMAPCTRYNSIYSCWPLND